MEDPIIAYSQALQNLNDLTCDDCYDSFAISEFLCNARNLREAIRVAWKNLPIHIQKQLYQHPCTTYNE